MAHFKRNLSTGIVIVMSAVCLGHARGQTHHGRGRPWASQVIMPQTRAWSIAPHPGQTVQITGVDVGVVIVEQVATTTMDITLQNPTRSRLEAELIVPVPDGAALRGFSFQGAAREPTAELLPAHEANRIYDGLVAKIRDPALMEFAGYNLIRTSVFPVEANGTQKLRLTYEHILPADGDRIDYVLPRSESLDYRVRWQVSVRIESKRPISTVYSPSHKLETKRSGANVLSARIAPDATMESGSFRLSYLQERNGVSASLLAYPDPTAGGGYFLMLVGLPVKSPSAGERPAVKREVTLVIDRSGSMNGEKLEQVREAAMQILSGLEDGEYFNLITYNETVDLFRPQPVPKSDGMLKSARAYLDATNARGGTNIHDALLEALRQKPTQDTLPLVLFLTDGLPTVGQTSEPAIRNVATKANPYHRRVFTFGVGVDVNTPLLERIALETRATARFVLPKEDVELKVAQVFERLSGPVLTGPQLHARRGTSRETRVRDMIPGELPDLFEDDQLVVLGRYVGNDPLTLHLTGDYFGKSRTFQFTFDLDHATTKNAFVPRLWASRKIALLGDAIRDMGATTGPMTMSHAHANDPRFKELVDEVVRLSTEFGILTEYTAFLALEGTDLTRNDDILAEARGNFSRRAVGVRSGMASVNQEMNSQVQRLQSCSNLSNSYWDKNMNRVSITNVQQVTDRAFFHRDGCWIDSRIVNDEDYVKPSVKIEFGSEEFRSLARRLAREGRQGTIALRGDILMLVDGKPVLVKGPEATPISN